MASQQEARLLTVVTLWRGRDAENRYAENARLVERILAPYVDHRLRVQSLVAAVRTTLQDETETNADAAGFISEPHFPPGEEVCFA